MKTIKKSIAFFCVLLLTLFIISSFAFSTLEFATNDNYLIAQASYNPLTVIANISLGKQPYCVAINPATNRIYVGVEDGLVVINGETDQIIAEIPLSDNVVALAANPLTNRIYAGVYTANVAVIDGATNLKVGEIPFGLYNSYALAVNPATNLVYLGDWSVWVGVADTVKVYDGETFQSVTSVELGILSLLNVSV